ncbi:MAG: ABC transporter ATP-binding protein [Planctomycetota bacterium]
MPPPPLLEIDNLCKSFGKLNALQGVSFSLQRGERLAFLGPNGAGKTTLIRSLSGRCKPDRGSIRLMGMRIDRHPSHSQIGLVPQDIALYPDLTTRQNLETFGRFHGLRRRELRHRVDWALRWTGLADRANFKVAGFSGGMKRRVNLACGVLHQPSLLLLDEPTVGVDPQSRHKIFEMLDELASDGTAILLATHHLDEAQQRSDRIVIMDHGKVIADGNIESLIRGTVGPQRMVRLRVDRPLTQALVGRTLGKAGQQHVVTRIDQVSTQLPQLIQTVRQHGYDVQDVQVHAPSLHDVFLHLTGTELRDS